MAPGCKQWVSHIMVHGLLNENQTRWDMEVVSDLFNERIKQLIVQIPIPIREKNDSWYWMLENEGNFSVKSCYRKIRGELLRRNFGISFGA